MHRRHAWGPATALALVLPLAATASSASTDVASPGSAASPRTDVVTTVAVELPPTETVTRRLRSVDRGELAGASPVRSVWAPVDLAALDVPATAMHAYQFAAYTMED